MGSVEGTKVPCDVMSNSIARIEAIKFNSKKERKLPNFFKRIEVKVYYKGIAPHPLNSL